MKKIEFNEENMLNSIKKSGYLFEGEILDYFEDRGFFIENNKVIEDRITGKGREIDIIGEYYDRDRKNNHYKCYAKTYIVGEIKNNDSPLVLLNDEKFSPLEETRYGIKDYIEKPAKSNYADESYWENLIANTEINIFSQYCSFQEKKNTKELMALHQDIIYSGLSKITEYCESMIEGKTNINTKDGFLRHICFLPVFIIDDDLYELEKGNEFKLNKVDSSILRFNYHYKGKPELAYVFISTKNGLSSLIDLIIENDEKIEKELIKYHS